MVKKRHTAEQIVTLLRQVEVAVGTSKSTPLDAVRSAQLIDLPASLPLVQDGKDLLVGEPTSSHGLSCAPVKPARCNGCRFETLKA